MEKLSIIKGGIESRFIPTFDQKTKSLIEGFFKITEDKNLRAYALSAPETVELTDQDELLNEVLEKRKASDDSDELGLLFDDLTQLTLDVLQ